MVWALEFDLISQKKKLRTDQLEFFTETVVLGMLEAQNWGCIDLFLEHLLKL